MAYTQSKANLLQTAFNVAATVVAAELQAGTLEPADVEARLNTFKDQVFGELASEYDKNPPAQRTGGGSRPPKVAADPGAVDLKFGKHKGKTIAEVAAEDSSYLDWIAKGTDPKGAYLRAQVEAFLDARRAGE